LNIAWTEVTRNRLMLAVLELPVFTSDSWFLISLDKSTPIHVNILVLDPLKGNECKCF